MSVRENIQALEESVQAMKQASEDMKKSVHAMAVKAAELQGYIQGYRAGLGKRS